jgi:hypothetical protein
MDPFNGMLDIRRENADRVECECNACCSAQGRNEQERDRAQKFRKSSHGNHQFRHGNPIRCDPNKGTWQAQMRDAGGKIDDSERYPQRGVNGCDAPHLSVAPRHHSPLCQL